MPPERRPSEVSHRQRAAIVAIFVVLFCMAYATATQAGPVAHFDHALYLDTVEYQRDGEGYYDAYLHAFADRDIALSELRAVRQPAAFLFWQAVPQGWLWPTYAVGVVGTTCLLMLAGVTRAPLAVLPVAAYLLLAGRIPSTPGVEQWMLVELWTLPALVGAVVCWRRGRHGPAAGLAALAVLLRETAVGFLAVGLVLAWWRGDRRSKLWWTGGAAVAAVAYGVHAVLAGSKLAEAGQDAVILGTGDPPRTIWEMVAWMVPGPDVVGVAVVAVGLIHLLSRRRDLLPLTGLFSLAGSGLLVARPYWGFLFIPFGILLCGEAVVQRVAGASVEP